MDNSQNGYSSVEKIGNIKKISGFLDYKNVRRGKYIYYT